MATFLSEPLQRICAIATSVALVLAGVPALAEEPAAPAQPQPLGQAQLEKLLAPIALYPDALVAQILTASTYPIEVVQAARWVSDHPDVHGDALQDAMQQQPWDPSVKGLTAVPQVLAMMNDKLDWMQQVGEAFLAQPTDVSNAIQQLRHKADANGNLQSSKEIKVSKVAAPPPPPPAPAAADVDVAMLPPPPPPEYIVIEPADPAVYYVPIYDPLAVYGPWPWPAYAPFYWYPPGYVVGAAAIGFGVGFFVGAALWCHYNWGGGQVNINVVQYNQFNRTNLVAARGGVATWRFNPAHRGTVGFQNAALRQQFGGPTAARPTLQSATTTNHPLAVNHGGTGTLNTNLQTNANLGHSLKASHNPNVNRTLNVNRNASVNRNINVNRNLNVNRNFNANRSVSFNRGANFARSANVGRPPPVGNKHR